MKTRGQVMVCCVCGRVHTKSGWQYGSRTGQGERVCSHGLCYQCYEREIMKIEMESRLTAGVVAS